MVRFNSPSKRVKIVILILALECFLILFFPPALLFRSTVITGGDTASHYPTAVLMRDRLFSGESFLTWVHGNYAGFPMFLHYFPLPFALMALVSLLTPMQVAFKLVTLAAVLPMPVAAYKCLRNMGYDSTVCFLGAGFSVLFLLTEENAMWGGNIASTLAGEFAYGMSMILCIYLVGKLYRDIPRNRNLVRNAFIESLIALCHGYPLLQSGFGSSFFLLRRDRVLHVICLHALAFAFAGFWLLPLLAQTPWNTSFSSAWDIQDRRELMPPILLPAVAGIAAGWMVRLWDRFRGGRRGLAGYGIGAGPEHYLWWHTALAFLCYAVTPLVGLIDIRFIPFAQMFLVLLGAIGWGKVLERIPYPLAVSCIAVFALVAAAIHRVEFLPTWVEWNYSGFESKPAWPAFRDVNEYLRGDANSPRVVYEHATEHNDTGTMRAFEMLPFFSGRSTAEGLYVQSAVNAPFVFYMESELSWAPACPFPQYNYTYLNPTRGAAHLRLFNASQFVAVTEQVKRALDECPDFIPRASFPPYRIYRVADCDGSYVVPLRYKPYRIPAHNWKQVQYDWFRKSSLDVPLVATPKSDGGEYWKDLPLWEGPMEDIPRYPIAGSDSVRASASLGDNRITVKTSSVMQPLWLKIAYHPDWRIVSGKGEIYLASPAFMLLVPHTPEVVIEFSTGAGVYSLGNRLTLLAVGTALAGTVFARFGKRSARARDGGHAGEASSDAGTASGGRQAVHPSPSAPVLPWVLMGGAFVAAMMLRVDHDPLLLYRKAVGIYERASSLNPSGRESAAIKDRRDKAMEEARRLFRKGVEKFPRSPVVDYSAFYIALTYAADDRWQEVIDTLAPFLERYPDSRLHADILYQIGLAYKSLGNADAAKGYLRQALVTHPDSQWGGNAAARLTELESPEALMSMARTWCDAGRYGPARALSVAVSESSASPAAMKAESSLLAARCVFHRSQWEEASKLLTAWISKHGDHPELPRAHYYLGRCRMYAGHFADARENFERALELDPSLRTELGKMLEAVKEPRER